MRETKLTILNTSILTSFGSYVYKPVTLKEAQELIKEFQQEGKTIESAVGHAATAEKLTMLLGFDVALNRMEYKQTVEDAALICIFA